MENLVKPSYSDSFMYNMEQGLNLHRKEMEQRLVRNRFSFDICDPGNFSVKVNYEKEPTIKPNEEFTADYSKNLIITRHCDMYTTKEQNISHETQNEYCFSITAGETVSAQNKIYVILTGNRLITPFVIPITLLG